MTKYRNRIMIAFAAVVMSLAMMPMITAQVHATDGVEYIYRSWNGSKVISTTKTANCVDYNSSMTNLHQGWWYVNGYHVVNDRVNVSGEVNIVIQDGSTLLLKDGIHVPSGSTLNIYNTPGGENGHFHALADTNYCAAIGGNDGEPGGNINIHSGKVTADAYNDNEGQEAAGIGGGEEGNGGNITIYGGKVEATGANYAAGIGSGDSDGDGVHGGIVKIYGGDVTAKGGCDAAGIGGGEGATGGNITISGGTITATGGTNTDASSDSGGAGIGGGEGASGGTITITGNAHIKKATGGTRGAAIGGGDDGSGGNITISGGVITEAQGGLGGAGIGGGYEGSGGTINISGGTIIKTVGGGDYNGRVYSAGGAGIGGGCKSSGDNITISGGDINAIGAPYAAAIGGSVESKSGTILINGGKVTANGGFPGGSGIGSGAWCEDKDEKIVDITINGGDIHANGGGRYSFVSSADITEKDEEGAAIGAGGRYIKIKRSGVSIAYDSFFNGKIVFNGGTVTTGRLGTTDDACLNDDSVKGEIEFNGATVTINQDITYSSVAGQSLVHADQIIIKEDSSLHQRVSYQESRGTSDTVVVTSDKRVETLKRPDTYLVKVEPCNHDGKTCTYKDDSKHSWKCTYCDLDGEENHSYGEPEWTWAEDNSTASAKITCVCGHAPEGEATVTSEKTGGGSKRTYTAKVTLNSKEYTDTKTVDLPGPSVTNLPTYKDLTYIGSEQDLGTAGKVTGGSFKYALGTDATTAPDDSAYEDSVPKAKDAGTYYVWCKVFGDDEHRDSAPQSGTVKIEKQIVSDPAIPDEFYTGSTVQADVPTSDLYTVTKNEGGIGVGEYEVELKLTDPANYKWVDSDEATHTLKFRIVEDGTNIVTVSIEGWTYGEDAKVPVVTATHGKGTAKIAYASSQDGEYSSEVPESAGIWWVKASIPAVEGSYPAGEDTARFEIEKAAPTVTPPTATPLTYTGEAQALVTKGLVEGGTMYYAVTTENAEPNEYAEAVPTATDTGIYNVWYKVDGDKNHKDYEPHKVMARISADKTELAEAITEAEGYYNSIKDNEAYGPAANKLSDAISEADEIANDPNASQQRTNEVKESVKNATAKAKEDIAKADAVKTQINNLHGADIVSIADKEDIEKAKAAYDALSDDQKALIPEGMKEKLSNAEKALAEKEKEAKDAADKAVEELVEQKIASLPAKPGLKDRNAVKAARAAYNNLTPDQKALVPAETLKKLTDAEKAIEATTKKVKTVTVNVKTVSAKAINNAVNKAGGSNKYVTKIVLGKKVKKISKGAFKSYKKVKTLEVRTKKLSKKTVKSSLKGSKITKVKVNVGKKKTNKKYIKKYKKIFTKKNCGKKVKVR